MKKVTIDNKPYEALTIQEYAKDDRAAKLYLVESKESVTSEIISARIKIGYKFTSFDGVLVDMYRFERLKSELQGVQRFNEPDTCSVFGIRLASPFEMLNVYKTSEHYFEGIRFVL